MIRRRSRPSIVLALALPLAALALAYAVVVQPIIIAYRDGEDVIAARRALAEQYRAIAAEGVVYARALDALRDDPSMRSAFFSGGNSAIVAATLQQQAKVFVQESGGTLQSTQILPDTVNEDVHRIAVRLRVVSDIDGLRLILERIQGNRPLLFVEQLETASRLSRRTRRVPAEHLLETQFDIIGFMRKILEFHREVFESGAIAALPADERPAGGHLPRSGRDPLQTACRRRSAACNGCIEVQPCSDRRGGADPVP